MARLRLLPAALVLTLATPALAQFGGFFGQPPRPPGNVPDYQRDERLPPRPVRPRREEPEPPPPPLTRLPPGQQQPATRGSLPPPASAQGQPLPPPGTPMQTNPSAQQTPAAGQPPLAGLPPGQRQPRPSAPPAGSDEVVVAPPKQKIVNQTAVFSGLDKITGRIISFDVAVDETVQFGALRLTPRACYTRPPNETPNTDSFIEVDEITLNGEVKRIFTGWMFAASPGLHGVEHPIYDVWLSDCKSPTKVAEAPPAEPASEPAASPPPAARPPARRQPPRQRANPPPQRTQPLPPPGAPRGY